MGKINFSKMKISKRELAGGLMLLAIVILPIVALAGQEKKIYVNDGASGTQNGSKDHPYKTIKEALKHADKNTQVEVAKGTYRENIEIPKGTEIHGSGQDEVFIKGDDDEPVVKMKDNTKIVGVTVEKGEYGIEVSGNGSAIIVDCIVRRNEKDGIKIKAGDTEKKHQVEIISSSVYDNGRAGIYSEKRKLVIMKSWIAKNDNDGIALSAGVNAWIEKNSFEKNGASGAVFVLDGSNVTAKKNLFANNKKGGMEINSFGASGRIEISSSSIKHNGGWGIARIQRTGGGAAWGGFVVRQPGVDIFDNGDGNISPVLRIN